MLKLSNSQTVPFTYINCKESQAFIYITRFTSLIFLKANVFYHILVMICYHFNPLLMHICL